MNTDTLDERHRRLMEQIDGYLDDELTPAERAQMEAHLAGCQRCRRALHLHGRLVSTLNMAPVPRASPSFRERIRQQRRDASPSTPVRRGRWSGVAPPWFGWALAAGLGAAIMVNAMLLRSAGAGGIPMVHAALADYRQHLGEELKPPNPQQLTALVSALPFPARPLKALSGRMVGAWRTTIRGEPAIAFAYHYQGHILVQYVVSRELFFRQPRIRQAIARHGRYSTTVEQMSIVAFPERDSGSLLMGAISPRVLESLRS